MYNLDVKERYIKYKTGKTILPENALIRLFDKTKKYEEKLGKDISCFTETEILNIYKMLGTRSVGFITNMNSYLAQYTDWCISQGLVYDGQNHFRILKKNEFEKCINLAATKRMNLTREELLDQIKDLNNAREKFIVLYLFEVGAKKYSDELRDMMIDQFDNNILHLKNRDVIISKELYHYAKEAAEADCLYPYKENGKASQYNTIPDGHVIQFRITERNSKYCRNRYYTVYMVAVSYLGLEMYKPKEMDYMGRIDRIKKESKRTGKTARDIIFDPTFLGALQKQYGFTGTPVYSWDAIKRYL